jgi:hypothetical protein
MNDPQVTTATQTAPSVEDALRDELRTVRSELRAANERIADLASQIDWKSKAKILTESETERINEQARAFNAMNDERNTIAKYLRTEYAAEIASGAHNGRSLAEIICGYLGELKALKTKQGAVQ